jgi:hypothetical protein
MPTKFLIVAVTVNAVLGQLLLRRALAMLGGRAALATLPKFALAAAASPWMYASLLSMDGAHLARETRSCLGECGCGFLHPDAALRMVRVRRVAIRFAMVRHQSDHGRRDLRESWHVLEIRLLNTERFHCDGNDHEADY